jgi:hypothetical protein
MKSCLHKSLSRTQPAPPAWTRCKSTRSTPSSSILENAADLWTNLRWRAVQQIAERLSPQERETILQQWTPKQPDVQETERVEQQHSIAEAVAQARMEEARKWETQWEKQKEDLLSKAEAAAQARVENDLVLKRRKAQFDLWQQQVQEEQTRIQQQQQHHHQQHAEECKSKPIEVVVEEAKEQSTAVTDARVHPVLGPVVLDLGYKRLYAVSAQTLSNVVVWEKQRIYRHDRVKAMATDKLKTLHLGIPGVIALYEVRTVGL